MEKYTFAQLKQVQSWLWSEGDEDFAKIKLPKGNYKSEIIEVNYDIHFIEKINETWSAIKEQEKQILKASKDNTDSSYIRKGNSSIKTGSTQKKGGDIVFIDEYDDIDSDEELKSKRDEPLFCLGCGGKLEYVRGTEKRSSYFRHSKHDRDPCTWSNESDLHLFIKRAIEQNKELFIEEQMYKGYRISSQNLNLDKIEVEKYGGDVDDCIYRPDIIAEVNGEKYWFEVVVTSEISHQKEQFIKDNNINCITIEANPTIDKNDITFQYILDSYKMLRCEYFNYVEYNKKREQDDKIKEQKQVQDLKDLISNTKYKDGDHDWQYCETLYIKKDDYHYNRFSQIDKEFFEQEMKKIYRLVNRRIRDHVLTLIQGECVKSILESCLIATCIVFEHRYILHQNLIDQTLDRINDKVRRTKIKDVPVINEGIYKGVRVDKLPFTYVYFIKKQRPSVFDKSIYLWLDTQEDADFIIKKEKGTRDQTEAAQLFKSMLKNTYIKQQTATA